MGGRQSELITERLAGKRNNVFRITLSDGTVLAQENLPGTVLAFGDDLLGAPAAFLEPSSLPVSPATNSAV
jgi:hypothetical protein